MLFEMFNGDFTIFTNCVVSFSKPEEVFNCTEFLINFRKFFKLNNTQQITPQFTVVLKYNNNNNKNTNYTEFIKQINSIFN